MADITGHINILIIIDFIVFTTTIYITIIAIIFITL